MSKNLQTVQAVYQAFATGDVPSILAQLSSDIDWEYSGAQEVPWLERRHGRDAVGGFFGALAENLEFEKFAVNDVLAGDRVVVALVDLDARVKRTGKRISERDEVHVWRFDESGKVVAFRHALDSAAHVRAWAG